MPELLGVVPSSAGWKTGVIRMRSAPPRLNHSSVRWGVVLAGGDGTRLQNLTRFICGDNRPKQFCPVLGSRTLLDEARQRAEKSIPAERTIFVVTRAHKKHYLRDLSHTPCQRIVQPSNKGTAPAILYGLLQIAAADPCAQVAILPCDHYYSDEDAFTLGLESAFETARVRSSSVVLLGAQPDTPEIEYGWIEVGEALHEGVYQVRGFHEKPPFAVAERLFRSGALWNTFVMVGHVQTFLELCCASLPGLVEVFQTALSTIDASRETRIPDALYDWVAPADFSRQVLSPAARHLVTLRLNEVEWHDLGHADRVMETVLRRDSPLPAWVRSWQMINGTRAQFTEDDIPKAPEAAYATNDSCGGR